MIDRVATLYAIPKLTLALLRLLPAPLRTWIGARPLVQVCIGPIGAAHRALCLELLWMAYRDQRARHPLSLYGIILCLQHVDQQHTERMKVIIAEYGWPGIALVGQMGAQAAWLLVQHADHDRPFQKACLALLAAAVGAGDAATQGLAYLTDRVRVAEGLPQVYGTQFHGGDYPLTIEDPDDVDVRRAAAGLEPLAEYVAHWQQHAKRRHKR
jgi:hypothetical protein